MVQISLWVELKEQLVSGYIEVWDDLLRIADQLGVEVLVEAEQVGTVDVEEWLLQRVDLCGRGRSYSDMEDY